MLERAKKKKDEPDSSLSIQTLKMRLTGQWQAFPSLQLDAVLLLIANIWLFSVLGALVSLSAEMGAWRSPGSEFLIRDGDEGQLLTRVPTFPQN